MVPAVTELVVGRSLPHRPARLTGFTRSRLRGVVYPGVAPRSGRVVAGMLWEGLDGAAWQRVDAFESEPYERLERIVQTGAGPRRAWVYAVRPRYQALLTGEPWSLASFERRHLRAYLSMCRRFASALRCA